MALFEIKTCISCFEKIMIEYDKDICIICRTGASELKKESFKEKPDTLSVDFSNPEDRS